ncbi:nicotianamine synthase [Paenibacillus pinisoli]|uniref:Nicotianamine synthase n=1 Tax=Paenibacillus pinisoli TaxID=1276110 RepID=A0A3A6PMT7_9BACL|nr:nicotianamine synthase family protein [Paenibacillus pinisoli]RJX39559.1 nicotianamine synthase [Paenibacillus pinisoli]
MKAYSISSAIHTVNAPSTQRVDHLIDWIRKANELLQKELDLSPANPVVKNIVNHLSLQLRSRYLPEEIQSVLSHEYIRMNQRQLRDKLSEAEFLAELSDSRAIGNSESSVLDTLTGLSAWTIYSALVSQELSMLYPFIREKGSADKLPIIFVGSGPMPLSGIILHQLSNANVICLEMDSIAYDASCLLLERLGLTGKVTVVMGNGSQFDYSPYRHIFVASLVHNKQEVLERIIHTASDPIVAIRTAEGMRQIMYEAIDEADLSKQGWRILGRTCPIENLVINSTLFLERVQNQNLIKEW